MCTKDEDTPAGSESQHCSTVQCVQCIVCLCTRDEDTLQALGLNTGAMLYFKDRGIQIGWTTVFLTEYAGPLFAYLWFYRYIRSSHDRMTRKV